MVIPVNPLLQHISTIVIGIAIIIGDNSEFDISIGIIDTFETGVLAILFNSIVNKPANYAHYCSSYCYCY